ncbi:MAG: BatA and WFA domain-containing protein [Anaerobacillus sp.]
MGFLIPSSFWLLALVGIIVVFYLFRKQFERTEIPSTFLWNQVMKEWEAATWWRKLQRNLLFYLQLLIILLLVFALARPYLTTERLTGDTGAIILDVSATMTAGKDVTRFDKAKMAVMSFIDDLGSGQSLTLVTAGAVPKVVFAKETDKENMKQQIEKLVVTYESENMEEAISLASSYLDSENGNLYIYSDDVTEEEVADVRHYTEVIDLSDQIENFSLSAFGVKGTKATATVENQTDTNRLVSIGIYANDELLLKDEKKVDAGKSYTFQFDNLQSYPYYRAEIEVNDDYVVDNKRYAFRDENEPSQVYLVGDTSPFLSRALSLLGFNPITITSTNGEYDYPTDENAIFVISKIERSKWPKTGNLLLFSPQVEQGASIKVEQKRDLEVTMTAEDSPYLKYVDMKEVYLKSAYPVSIPLKPIVRSGELPILLQGDWNGRTVMYAAFDLSDSDWPLHPGFPIFIQNTVQQLSGQSDLGTFKPGEVMQMSFPTTTELATLENEEGKDIGQFSLDESLHQVPYPPGLYSVNETKIDGYEQNYFQVSLSQEELHPYDNQSFTSGTKGETESSQGKLEWWHAIAVIAFLVLLFEWEVYRRGLSTR